MSQFTDIFSFKIYRKVTIVLLLLLLLMGILAENRVLFSPSPNSEQERFLKVLHQQEDRLKSIMTDVVALGIKSSKLKPTAQVERYSNYIGLLDRQGIAILIYQNDSLQFTSDVDVVAPLTCPSAFFSKPTLNLQNALFVVKRMQFYNKTIVGLIRIKHAYQFENKYLSLSFDKSFDLPAGVKVVDYGGKHVFSKNGTYLFGLQFGHVTLSLFWEVYFPSAVYLLIFLLLLVGAYQFVALKTAHRNRWIIGVILAYALIRFGLLLLHLPSVFYRLELFNPSIFAYSFWIPSLGDLALWVLLLLFSVYLTYRYYTFSFWAGNNLTTFKICILFVVLFSIWAFVDNTIKVLIDNSLLALNFSKLLLLDLYSLVAYSVIASLLIAGLLISDLIIKQVYKAVKLDRFIILLAIVGLSCFLAFYLARFHLSVVSFVFYLVFSLVIAIIRYKIIGYSFPALIVLVLLGSLFSVISIEGKLSHKEQEQNKVLLSNLASEHDPVAEFLLRDVYDEMQTDTIFKRLVLSPSPDITRIRGHARRNYFDGYLSRYNIRSLIVCKPEDSLYLDPPDNKMTPCLNFFESLVNERGTKLPDCNFYYLDNRNGRISYLGWVDYASEAPNRRGSAYIELESKSASEKIGYPDLLLDYRFAARTKLKDYSLARYYKRQLVSGSGVYSYNMSSLAFEGDTNRISIKSFDGYNHLIFRQNSETLVILSTPKLTMLNRVVSFSYVFVFYFLIVVVLVIVFNYPILKNALVPNFKNKIQYAMIAVLLASLLLIGGGTLYFDVKQYHQNQRDNISEKTRSVYFELAQRFDQDAAFVPGGRLNDVLTLMSIVFYSDVNIFDAKGNLVASSRPDIFNKGLIGSKINPEAQYRLVTDSKSEVILKERIGSLTYSSAYIPFYNINNKLLGYINLPYFTLQEELAREVSTMIIAAVNVYVVLLLLTILLAVFISSKVTMPLQLIQRRFRQIKLGQKYERIDYASNDEIGGLVDEYNRMVTELERHIELLAKSERESAWREMAKQIAHEIKNPLTPMKLSVQHLQRAWVDKHERFDEYMQRITKTVIEEIDNLSAIASEFSNFAKMPEANKQSINIVEKVLNMVDLFESHDVQFIVNQNNIQNIIIEADKEHISRVFINIFKNAIQSVSKGIMPVIKIDISLIDSWVEIAITDNGQGIAPEIQEKLFRPNFTTKTSGMGLGLAIVKNIVEESGGTIRFETKKMQGTTFFIRWPLNNIYT